MNEVESRKAVALLAAAFPGRVPAASGKLWAAALERRTGTLEEAQEAIDAMLEAGVGAGPLQYNDFIEHLKVVRDRKARVVDPTRQLEGGRPTPPPIALEALRVAAEMAKCSRLMDLPTQDFNAEFRRRVEARLEEVRR